MEDGGAVTTSTEVVTSDGGGGKTVKTTKRTVVEESSHSSRLETSSKATRVITSSTGARDVQVVNDSNVVHSNSAIAAGSVSQSQSSSSAVQSISGQADEQPLYENIEPPPIDLQSQESHPPPAQLQPQPVEQKSEMQEPQSQPQPRAPEPQPVEMEPQPQPVEPQQQLQPVEREPQEPSIEEEPPTERSPVADEVVEPAAKPSMEEGLKENIKEQLEEIINEIDQEVEYDEEDSRRHTWQPKGQYDLEKTQILYEDIVAVKVDDVTLSERKKKLGAKKALIQQEQPPAQAQQDQQQVKQNINQKVFYEQGLVSMNGEMLSPVEIPAGIPLLAMVLPKDEESENREKIPLERLFTPATDSGEITPKKGKVFANSAFYRPDHPTIDDQLKLAHTISDSLVDKNNTTSRGQNMYIKRKNRSDKWIHEGGHGEVEDYEGYEVEEFSHSSSQMTSATQEIVHPKLTMPALRPISLAVNSPDNMPSPQNIIHNKEITQEVQSPTGKGAALFAKRKRRMDKFIVDETTIKQQEQSFSQYSTSKTANMEQTSSSDMSQSSSSQYGSSTFNQQSQVLAPPGGAMYTAEVRVVKNSGQVSGQMSFNKPLIEMPVSGSCLTYDELSQRQSEEERRKSFNLAPKGWGTYQDFYTPVHLGAR